MQPKTKRRNVTPDIDIVAKLVEKVDDDEDIPLQYDPLPLGYFKESGSCNQV